MTRKLLNLLLLLTLSLACMPLASCGGDDDDSPSLKVKAYSGSGRIEGTDVEIYISTKGVDGKLIMFLPNGYRQATFSGDLGFEGGSTWVYVDGSRIDLERTGSGITMKYQNQRITVYPTNVKDYWQEKYDYCAQQCEKCYNEYINKTVRYPELALMAAKNHQSMMTMYRYWAEEDGARLRKSPWESKALE